MNTKGILLIKLKGQNTLIRLTLFLICGGLLRGSFLLLKFMGAGGGKENKIRGKLGRGIEHLLYLILL